jgi:hypothetical protein
MKSYKYIPLTLSLVLVILFGSCANENTTTVTLNFDTSHISFNNKVKELPLIDKFLCFFSGTAYAVTGWNGVTTKITLSIIGQDMDTITADIPFIYSGASTTSYTVTVPSGSKRNFTIVTTALEGDVPKNWGGQTVVDLAPGDDVKLTINMIPMTLVYLYTTSDMNFYSVSYTGGQGYNIYWSATRNGNYSLLTTATPITASWKANANPPGGYYKISVFGTTGEGVLSPYP